MPAASLSCVSLGKPTESLRVRDPALFVWGKPTEGRAAWPGCVQVDEVKGIMTENIEKVLARGEKLELLTDKTENLMFEAGAGAWLRGGGWAICLVLHRA